MAKPIHASQDAIHAEGNSLSRCLHLDKLEFELLRVICVDKISCSEYTIYI